MKTYRCLRTALAIVLVAASAVGLARAQEPTPLQVATATGPVTGVSLRGSSPGWASPTPNRLSDRCAGSRRSRLARGRYALKANTVPSSCAQNADLGPFARAGGNEDCLYLNVYRSAEAARSGERLPVFVWVHGGALQVGQGADYDPSKLAATGKAVVVTLNYRLGLFGFFSHPAIDREGHPFANYGLMDQQAALRWVQQNIAAFGGDPANVTIAGESSGGNSVMLQIVSPLAAGTFQHAVAMSGAGVMTRHPAFGARARFPVAEELGTGFAKDVGCEADTANCLRALSTKRVLDAQTPYLLNEAIIDGTVIPMHPSDAYRTGQINRVTLVNGSTRDEGRFFVALPELLTGQALTAEDYPVWMERQYGAALATEVMREYSLDRFASPGEAFAAASHRQHVRLHGPRDEPCAGRQDAGLRLRVQRRHRAVLCRPHDLPPAGGAHLRTRLHLPGLPRRRRRDGEA
jgi:para-nitrobenzyl esterase